MSTVKNYVGLIKLSHTIFAMPFAVIGFGLGITHEAALSENGSGREWILKGCWVLGCMVFARSSAMSFNRYLDRKIDALNPRTRAREIPAGAITPKQALLFTVTNAVLFVVCACLINPICFSLSPIALGVILGYSYTKRFTAFCHLILGLGLSLSVIGAYLAITGTFDLLPIFFSMAVLTWVAGFDIIYALQDESFDRSNQLHSLPAWLGGRMALSVSSVLHFMTISCLFLAGIWADFGYWYWIGVAVFAGLLIYQHALVTSEDLTRVDLAFMTTNGLGSVIFSIFVILELIFST